MRKKRYRQFPAKIVITFISILSILICFSACGKGKPDGTHDTTTAALQVQTQQTETRQTKEPETDSTAKNYDISAVHTALILQDDAQITGGTYIATGTDESVLEAVGSVNAEVSGAVLQKTGGDASGADASSFYGINAAVRASGSAELTLHDCDISAAAQNATGVFSYENSTIRISDSTVNVTGGGAGGIQVAGGGTLIGTNLTVKSASKAAIRSDRGGGKMIIDGGSYTSTGTGGCPAIYSTADIAVSNAECVSENSRAVIIEGKNTVTVENCTLSGNDQSTKEGSVKANVLLYQSASGDASTGTSVFTMHGGSMTCRSGAMFYCTNTDSEVYLRGADLTLSEAQSLIIVSAGRWGKDGKNGGNCVFNAEDQTLEGSIYVDEISTLKINLMNSSYTGAATGDGNISITMDRNSTWKLTGDSYVTSLSGDTAGLDLNGYHLYVNGVLYTE